MLREFAVLALVALAVAGCGIKGPLRPAPEPASAPPAADAAAPAADDPSAPRKP